MRAVERPAIRVLDFFAGSGTTGAVAHDLGRRFVLVDDNPVAIDIMRRRLDGVDVRFVDIHGEPLPMAQASS